MKIRIGNDIFLGGDKGYYLESPISGLTSPAIRTADGLRAGVDGGYVSSQLYGFRTITLSGFYIGKNCEEADQLRLDLMTKLHIRYLYPVLITTFSGRHYFTEAYITDVKSDITGPLAGEYQITLICPDPIIYDGGDGISPDSAIMEQMFYKEKDGGFKIDYPVPVQWTAGQLSTEIKNSGTVDNLPKITLRGKFTNPKITNITTKKFIKLNLETKQDDVVVIDMRERVITKNGVTVAFLKTEDSVWWNLIPGSNFLTLETDSKDDNNYGTITWKNGVEGI